MAQFVTDIPGIFFAGNLQEIEVSSEAAAVRVRIYSLDKFYSDNDTLILDEVYATNPLGRLFLRGLPWFFTDRLHLDFPIPGTLQVPQFSAWMPLRFEVVDLDSEGDTLPDTSDISDPCFVLLGGIRHSPISDEDFTTSNFLTWQPSSKYVKADDPEYLTFFTRYGDEVYIMATAEYANGSSETIQLYGPFDYDTEEDWQVNMFSVYVQWQHIVDQLSGTPYQIKVWLEDSVGSSTTILTDLQTYILTDEYFDNEDVYMFTNSIGGIDTIRLTGVRQLVEKFTPETAIRSQYEIEYDTTPEQVYIKNTGDFRSEGSRRWLRDLFASLRRYTWEPGVLTRIILEARDMPSERHELNNYTFRYRTTEQSVYQRFTDFASPAEVQELNIMVDADNVEMTDSDLITIRDSY